MSTFTLFCTLVVASAHPQWLTEEAKAGLGAGEDQWELLSSPRKFTLWKQSFEREYRTEQEEAAALEAFIANEAIIQLHNDDTSSSYRLGHNIFSDMRLEEFRKRNGLDLPIPSSLRTRAKANAQVQSRQLASTPHSVDWVDQGAVTDVKNQGICGSCWSFSTTGAVEGAYFVASGELVSLSEQQLVSCDSTDNGCSGGTMDSAFTWIKQHGGICTESEYPYTSAQVAEGSKPASCRTGCSPSVTVTGYHDVTSSDEDALRVAVAQQPVSVAVEADSSAFQLYSSGVFTSASCGTSLDHGVLVVGYGADSGTDYWKVKNSWGSSWGEGGYIRLERGVDMCGVSKMASYPTGVRSAADNTDDTIDVSPSPSPSNTEDASCAWYNLWQCDSSQIAGIVKRVMEVLKED